ncbi:hypothetical protein V6N11_005053 [Hibiscus sabdariffa]|uniref:Secreted protein n=1 Tax=Hibiscus sabdariffa TaxID=183260 RepID=A0ABR2N682_9ROSI
MSYPWDSYLSLYIVALSSCGFRSELALTWSTILSSNPSFANLVWRSCSLFLPSASGFPTVLLCQPHLAFSHLPSPAHMHVTAKRTTLHSGNTNVPTSTPQCNARN